MPGVAASRLDQTEGCFAGRTTLMGQRRISRRPANRSQDAGWRSGENYFSSGCAPQFDDWLFSTVKAVLTQNPAEFSASSSPDPPRAPAVVPRVQYTAKLRGEQLDAKELKDLVDSQSLAGLRNTAVAISRLPFHRQLGSILSQLFAKILRENPVVRKMLLKLATGELSSESAEALSAELDTHLIVHTGTACRSIVLLGFGAGEQCDLLDRRQRTPSPQLGKIRQNTREWKCALGSLKELRQVSIVYHRGLTQSSRCTQEDDEDDTGLHGRLLAHPDG